MPRLFFTGVGASVMGLLMFMRQRFLWWPLHPLGFPVALTWPLRYDWFAIFIAWLAKSLVLRYGGVRLYRILLPFFLGLILGEFFISGFWSIVDGITGVSGHVIFDF